MPIEKTITVSSGVTTEIILDKVNIKADNPFDAQYAEQVTLILRGKNTIEAGLSPSGPAVSCPVKEGTRLTIKEDVQGGSLTAKGSESPMNKHSAGIGFRETSNELPIMGSIFIESGTITATGGESSAGIGLSSNQKGGTIHIKGGKITATGGYFAAGIGGSDGGGNTTIIINDGTITATGGSNVIGGNGGAGIGGGYRDQGGKITITGGKITANGGTSAADIGAGNGGEGYAISISGGVINAQNAGIGNSPTEGNTPSTFLTGDAGKAIIFATSISAQTDKEHWSGLIFENNEGKIYGDNPYIVNQDVTIPEGHTLIIEEGKSLSIDAGKTLTNNGKIVNRGTFNFEVSGHPVIHQYQLTEEMITVAEGAVYKGIQCTPEVTVQNTSGSGLVASSSYQITYGDNINAGVEAGTVTIRMNDPGFDANGALFGVATKTFPIDKAEPEITFTLPAGDALVYNGTAKEATVSVRGVEGETATLTASLSYQKKTGGVWGPLSSGVPTDAGTYQAVATSAETDNYKQWTENSDEFTIAAKELTTEMVSLSPTSFTYNGKVQKPDVTVTDGNLITKNDYEISYSPEACTNADTYTVRVTGQGNYQGTVNKTFTIAAKELTTEMVSLSPTSFTYNGNEQKPTVTVADDDLITENDYEISYSPEGCTDAGTYTVTITGKGNYKETVTKTFTIAAKNLTADMVSLSPTSFTYNGNEQKPTVTVTDGDLITENDYEISYSPEGCTNADTYTVTITGKGNYTGEIPQNYTIGKATPTITLTVPTVSDLVYNGTAKEATVSVSGVAGETLSATLSYEKKTGDDTWGALQEGNKPTDVGAYRVTAKFDGNTNYNPAESQIETYSITPADAGLSFAQTTLTMTKGNAVPANALTKPEDCTVNYTSSESTVATVDAATGAVTVVGVGTTTITATAQGNYTGTATYTLTVNRYIPPYTPPTPDPDPVYYTVTIPTEVTGAIIHGGGTHEVEEYTYYTFRIELDPNGNGEYPTVTKGYWWDTLTPDGQGNYRVYVTGNTQITIGEVPTNSYTYYQVTLPTDSVTEAENQYWSGDYIEVIGATPLRAAEAESIGYQALFGATVTVRPIETERRKFLQWEDGSTQKERTLTLRADQEIKALWKRISPTGIEAIADGSVIRGERGQLYIEVPEPCDVTLYTYGGVPVRVARLAAGANRLANLNAGLYLVKIGAAPAVPVRIR